MAPSSRREKAVEGLVLGCAVGEALSLARNGLGARNALKLYGRTPLSFQFQPGQAVAGERTHGLLMAIQAMLESRADHRSFGRKLRNRVMWYRIGFPVRSLIRLGRSVRFGRSGDPFRLAADPMVRAASISVVIQGSQHGQPWVEESLDATCRGDCAFEASMLITYAAQLAQMIEPQDFQPTEVMRELIATTDDPRAVSLMTALAEQLQKKRSVATAARLMGWRRGIPRDPLAIAAISIYAWLRHVNRFRNAVERGALLGGQCAAVASLTGALSGITLGKRGIPPEWLKRVTLFPHDKEWLEGLIGRVKDWPHGVEDIQHAHAEPSQVIGQIVRNAIYIPFRIFHLALQIPSRFAPVRQKSRGLGHDVDRHRFSRSHSRPSNGQHGLASDRDGLNPVIVSTSSDSAAGARSKRSSRRR